MWGTFVWRKSFTFKRPSSIFIPAFSGLKSRSGRLPVAIRISSTSVVCASLPFL